MSVDGIPAIGYSPLATYGLPSTGMYGNYGDPAMSYMYGAGSISPTSFMGAPVGGYNPMNSYLDYIKQYSALQGDLDRMQIQSAGATNQIRLQTETQALANQDEAVFRKAMVDASVNTCIRNLAEKVQEGDTNGIYTEYQKLKNELYTKFADDFASSASRVDSRKSVEHIIEMLYSNIVSAQRGSVADLRSDIKRFGETPIMHGFNKAFLGKSGYHEMNTEQLLSKMYDTPLDNIGGKERMEKAGGYMGKGAELALSVPAGAAAGLTAAGILGAIWKTGTFGWGSFSKMTGRFGKLLVPLGMLVAPVADWMWQKSRA